jgi:hypothetical protein
MTRRVCLVLLALGAAVAAPAESEKKPAEPFYRKYLVPGNRLDDQIVEQEHRVDASPEDASLRNDFGNLLAARRFPHQAAEQYEIAADLDKANFVALYNLGLLRESEGKNSAAIKAYKRSIDRKPGFPQSHFRLGRLYEKSGRNEEAIAEYAAAMRIDRSMRDPRRNPLVLDSTLMYRASLVNYPVDVASVSMVGESVFVEESRFRSVPVDRAVSSQEAVEEHEAEGEPRQIGVSDAAGSGAADTAPAGGSRRGGTPGGAPAMGRPPRPQTPRRANTNPRGGTPLVAAPPGASVPPPPPPQEVTPPPGEPEIPAESVPEPTPEAPMEEEPS